MYKHGEGSVPNEILVQILSGLSTDDLLQHCRLVSRRWNQVAARVCRQRQVKFESGDNFENLQLCATIFKHPENVPWSSISLSASNSRLAAHSGQVAEIYGPKITSLHLTCSEWGHAGSDLFGTVPKILSLTPNLRKLDIFKISDQNLWAIVPKLLETRLQHLSAEVTYTGQSDSWTLLANQRQLTIENLSLISIGRIRAVDYYRPLERFLGSCSGGLKSLKMIGFLNYQNRDIPEAKLLKIPALPNLKHIELLLINYGQIGDGLHQRRCLHFEKLRAAHFPALESVHFQMEWEGEDRLEVDDYLQVSDVFGATENGPFATVKALSVGDRLHDHTEWAPTFPNITRLTATLCFQDYIEHIVRNLHLTELNLTLKMDEEAINLSLCLMMRFLPSLTPLKKLTIKNGNDDGEPLSDPGAITLALLRPLHLTITNAQLSDNCVSLLLERHLTFELN